MNIINYKIDEDNLNNLINKAKEMNLVNIYMTMSSTTYDFLCEILSDKMTSKYSYNGVLIKIDGSSFGEITVCGYTEKTGNRVTTYTDGTKVEEDNITTNFFTCIHSLDNITTS